MKKKVLRIAYRVIPCIVCVMIVVASLVMPAQAAAPSPFIDWNDYIDEIYIDNDTNFVTVKVPKNLFLIYVRSSDYSQEFWGTNGKPLKNLPLVADTRYTVTFYTNPHTPFYLGNIPNGANISVTVSVTESGNNMYSTPVVSWLYKAYDADNKWLADLYNDSSNDSIDGMITRTGVLTKELPHGEGTAAGGVFGIECRNFEPLESAYYSFTFESLSFTFPLSAVAADNVMYQQNQKLMKEIINGTPEMNDQVSGAVGGMNSSADKLDQLGDSMNVDKPDVSDMPTDIGSLVNYNSILAYVGPFLAIWDNNSTLFGFLTIILTLVLVSWVMFGKKG